MLLFSFSLINLLDFLGFDNKLKLMLIKLNVAANGIEPELIEGMYQQQEPALNLCQCSSVTCPSGLRI